MDNLRIHYNQEINNKKKENLNIPNTLVPSLFDSSDNFQPSGKRVRVYVIYPNARIMTFVIDTNKCVMDLKHQALNHSPITDEIKRAHHYRLIRAEYTGAELNEGATLKQLGIQDFDSVILLHRRNILTKLINERNDFTYAKRAEIEKITANVPIRVINQSKNIAIKIFRENRLYYDVKNAFISLAQKAAAIIGSGPYAQRVIEILKYRIRNKQLCRQDILKCFTDLGFDKDRAEYALKVNNGNYSLAFEWLVRRQNTDVLFSDTFMKLEKSNSVLSISAVFSNNTIADNINALRELIRIHCHCQAAPCERTVFVLMDMGFEEIEVIKALKKACNNALAAVELICESHDGGAMELTEGLSKDSKVLKNIMALSRVQMHLSNPKVLLAFLSIIENEPVIHQMGDDEIQNVVTRVVERFHVEKHNLWMEQINRNRADI